MTQPTNTFDSYDARGNREDLLDVIYNIDPYDVPFMSMIDRTSASNVLHEWQTDSLAAASTGNAQIEGDDATGNSLTASTRLQNYSQISRKVIVVSKTQEAINHAGRASEIGYQVAKAVKELKRDMESIITQNQGYVVGDATTARKTRSLESFLTTNTSRGTNGSNGSTTTAATDATTAGYRAFTEDLLKTVIKSVYSAGGDPDTIMVGPFNKQKLSGFAGNASGFRDSEKQALITSVSLYVSDFGEMQVVPNRFQRDRTAFVLQRDMWALAYLRPFEETELAKTGDAEKRLIVAEYALESRNEAASGVIADLTTS